MEEAVSEEQLLTSMSGERTVGVVSEDVCVCVCLVT